MEIYLCLDFTTSYVTSYSVKCKVTACCVYYHRLIFAVKVCGSVSLVIQMLHCTAYIVFSIFDMYNIP
jgi:hypothetical protein